MRILGQKSAAAIVTALMIFSVIASLTVSVVSAQEDDEDQSPDLQENDELEQEDDEDQQTDEEENDDDDLDEGDEDDEDEGEIERDVEVEAEEDSVKIESRLEKENAAGEIENKFEIEFEVDGEVEIELKYEGELKYQDNVEVEQKTELEYKIEFESIIEFVDNDGDNLYDEGEEVSIYELQGREFTPISYTIENLDNTTVHKITTHTSDGIFKVTLYASGGFATIGSESVRPNEVKIDIEINNFPYTDDGSKLALESKIKSEMETEEEREMEDDEEKITITSGDYQGFFSWKPTAEVDGTERPVLSTELMEEEGEKTLYLIYEHGDSIIHDPKVGVLGAIGMVTMPWMTVIAAAIIAALISIGAARYIVRRRG